MYTPGVKRTTLSIILLLFSCFLWPHLLESQANPLRGFDELFPDLEESLKKDAFSEEGLIISHGKNSSLTLIPSPLSGIELHTAIKNKNPLYIAESLLVLPYEGRPWNKLDAYNALGKIRDLKGRLYHSFTRDSNVPLFEDATRLESDKRNNPIPDPPPSTELPLSETVFIRLKDVNFGNSYYRGNFSQSFYGVSYDLTNYRNLTYLLFTVMKEEKFTAMLYMEALAEGMLIYSIAGADASDFIANRIHIPSAIEKRLAVFIGWIRDGLINE